MNMTGQKHTATGNGQKSAFICLILIAALIIFCCGCAGLGFEKGSDAENGNAPENENASENSVEEAENDTSLQILPQTFDAVYLGVKNYGATVAVSVQKEGAQVYRFEIDGEEKLLAIKKDSNYTIQNKLMDGYKYRITVEGDVVTDAEYIDETTVYEPVVKAEPGLKTLRNFLATAFEPLGTTLYVYGGAWNWQDDGSSLTSTTIGVPGSVVDFYRSQNADYMYMDRTHPTESTFPFGGWNQFYFAGMDCSGFAGWTVYNTRNTESGGRGYVDGASYQAYMFDKDYAFGEWTADPFNTEEDPLRPGDMISTPSHIWICVGRCEDESIIAIHSTVTASSTGKEGGGVQLSAINPNDSGIDCEAYRLACEYTEKYFPEWAERYPVVLKNYKDYVDFQRSSSYVGRFRWDLSGGRGLSDPDGFADMSAEEVLKALFEENAE